MKRQRIASWLSSMYVVGCVLVRGQSVSSCLISAQVERSLGPVGFGWGGESTCGCPRFLAHVRIHTYTASPATPIMYFPRKRTCSHPPPRLLLPVPHRGEHGQDVRCTRTQIHMYTRYCTSGEFSPQRIMRAGHARRQDAHASHFVMASCRCCRVRRILLV